LILLYREFLGFDICGLGFNYAKRKPKVPIVLSKAEAASVIQELSGVPKLVTQLMYGSGLRISEALNLRVKDIDFANGGLFVMEAKGVNLDARFYHYHCTNHYIHKLPL